MSKRLDNLKAYLQAKEVYCENVDGKLRINAKQGMMSHTIKEYILMSTAVNKGLTLTEEGSWGIGQPLEWIIEDATSETGTQDDYSISTIKPKGDRIVVRVIPPGDTSLGGITIPDSAKDKAQFGIVMRAGPKVDDETKEMSKIIYGQWAGSPLTIQGVEYLLMRDSDILCYI